MDRNVHPAPQRPSRIRREWLMSLTLTNTHPILIPSPPWRRQVKPAHDTPLPFNFKYFFIVGLGIKVRPSRCGAAGPALIGFVALTSRRRKSGGGKRLSAGTPDISTLKSNAGTSIEFRSIKSRDACLAPAWHATPWFIASRLTLDDGSLLDPTTWALVALMPARVQFTRDRHEPGHQAIGRPPGSRARRIFHVKAFVTPSLPARR